MLLATTSVMDLIGTTADAKSIGIARFASKDDDTGEVTRTVDLAFEDYVEMGEPKQITMTIEPGDTLNG